MHFRFEDSELATLKNLTAYDIVLKLRISIKNLFQHSKLHKPKLQKKHSLLKSVNHSCGHFNNYKS